MTSRLPMIDRHNLPLCVHTRSTAIPWSFWLAGAHLSQVPPTNPLLAHAHASAHVRSAACGAQLCDHGGPMRRDPLGLQQLEVARGWLDEHGPVTMMLAQDPPIHVVHEDSPQQSVAGLRILEHAANVSDASGRLTVHRRKGPGSSRSNGSTQRR